MIIELLTAILLAVSPADTEMAGKHYTQAYSYYSSSELVKASGELSLSLELDPAFKKSLELKTRLENEKFKEAPGSSGEIAKEYFEKGLVYFRKGETAKAAEEWKKGSEACPENLQLKEFAAKTKTGNAEIKIKNENNFTGAKREAKKTSAKPKEPALPLKLQSEGEKKIIDNLYYAGMKLYKAGKFAEAKSKWEQVIKLDPLHAKAKQNLDKLNTIKQDK